MILVILLVAHIAHSDSPKYKSKAEYYEDLINEEVMKSEKYQVRIDNSDLLGDTGNSTNVRVQDFGNFDFIVVGGGSAGSVVASRLSEIKSWKILLLEAGGANDEFSDIPYFYGPVGKSDRNWGYSTVPQKNGCLGRLNKQCPYQRGKILGGSGSINQLVYARGIKSDFDKWAIAGNPSWSWNKVLPYFKKLENFQSSVSNLKYRGSKGPLNIAYTIPNFSTQQAIIEANEEIGIPYIEDYNAEKVSGVSYIQYNIEHGRRASGANNYIRAGRTKINLNVTLKAFVTKILIEERTKSAYGVEFMHKNTKFRAIALKEVILSGGAANSPQLLMLSGIGPKLHLESLGIKVLQASPVGKYMKDHIGFLFLYFTSNYSQPTKSTEQLVKEYLDGQGAFTIPTFCKIVSYYNVSNMSSPNPNMEMNFILPQPVSKRYPEVTNLRKGMEDFIKTVNPTNHFNIHVYSLHPKSSGTLTLKSSSARDFPLIDSNIFDDPEDLEDMYRGIQVALNLTETSLGRKFNLKLRTVPLCNDERALSKKYWMCLLLQLVHPAYHLSSTAKMGPVEDPLAVVNDELKVYGIKNLRVIDARIVPNTVTGHMNAVAFLIGEKGTDFIKKDHISIS